ncbi:MAG: YCF48-related protein, partial [Candidatus Cloacimonetes bacterium]|nr:YCF48-related protein [Candidatus Cloacimonadota bacterium]
MKKITIIVVVFACLIGNLFAWDLSRQTAFPSTFAGMGKINNHFWVVGSGGAVVKSTNGGNTWQFVESPAFDAVAASYKTVNAVSFADENHGVIVGNSGFMAYTDDGGETWTVQAQALSIFGTSHIKAAHLLPSGKLIIGGGSGLIAYSSNYGETLSAVASPTSSIINTIYMEESGLTFFGCGTAVVYKSENFGTNWTSVNINNPNNPNIYSIKKHANRLILTGNKGYIGFSDDNGTSFTHHDNLGSSSVSIYDSAWNGTIGYAAASNGFIVTTNNNFSSVEVADTHFPDAVRGAAFNTSNELIAAASYGSLMKWDTTIEDWHNLVPNAFDLYDIAIANDNTWYVVGDRASMYKTSNGGQTYNQIYVQDETTFFYATKFFDENTGIVTGKTSGNIYKTTDGGNTWTSFTVPNVPAAYIYRSLSFINEQIGYAIGNEFNAKTTDGGNTWTVLGNAGLGTPTLYSSYFKNENIGFAGSAAGAVYLTTDGGSNWTSFTLGNKIITDIFFYDNNNGFILTEATVSGGNVSQAGKLFRTTNGGMTVADWTEVVMPVSVGTLNSITRLDDGTLYLAGYSNNPSQQGTNWAIMKSIDDGETWTEESLPSLTFNPTQFRKIRTNNNKIVAIGNNQLVMAENLQGSNNVFATDLFFSEYIEGTSNNKALEIYNGTGQTVDLSNYKIKLAANGNAWNESNTYQMTGTLAHGETFVIAHAQASNEIKDLADVYPNSSNPTNYNGNDCSALFKNDEMIDIIGEYNLGYNPPNWDVAGVTGATQDHTLIRKPTVISPTTDWALSAGTNEDDSQWIVHPVNYFDDLGQHTFSPQAPTATFTPTFSPGTGSYFGSIEVTIASATEDANIYYTTDGTDPSNQSNAYSNPITITETTTLKAIAYAEGLEPSNIATANYTIIVPIENANIAALRQQDDDNSTIYKLTGEAIVTFKQTYRNQKFVQDATAAILIDDQANVLGDYDLYDGITGIVGKLTSFGGMLQFTPVLAGDPASSTDNQITPTIVTVADFNNNFEDYEASLVQIDGLHFTSTGNFANGQVYTAVNAGETLNFRTSFYDVDYIGSEIPSGTISIVGIANSTDDGSFLSARNADDFTETGDTPTTLYPPQDLRAEVIGSDVTLAWDEAGAPTTWITHSGMFG